MNNAPSGVPAPLAERLLTCQAIVAALLSLGFCLASSGCLRGEPQSTSCTEGCAIEGSYLLTFDDSSPLSPECDAIDISLPFGDINLSRDDGRVSSELHLIKLSGIYNGGDNLGLVLSGDDVQWISSTKSVRINVTLDGAFTVAPTTTTEQVGYVGTYHVFHNDISSDVPLCDETRTFTAGRNP